MNTIDCLKFSYHQSSKPHCQKCGRRHRSDNTYKNNHRVNNEQYHCHQLKYQRQQRRFPTELPPYPINDNHFISLNKKNVFIDQVIQVQPLNTRSYDYKIDEYQRSRDTINSDILKRVQQMIYLRENINNLTYREVHFSNEYIILKRLEEKNNFINQNRFKVDHYFRSLKLQYQTISTLSQNITITSFTYSKEDPYQSDLIINTSFNRPIHSVLPTAIEMNDTITNESSLKQNDSSTIDDPVFITSYNKYKHQPYSQNAIQSRRNINHVTTTKKQDLTFDTAVIVDVRKCSELTTHRIPIQDHWNHIQTTWSRPFPENNQQITIPNQYPVTPHPHPTTSTDTIKKKTNQSIKYTQTVNKIKQILNTLQKNLLNKYYLSTQIDKSLSTTMTSDSLVTTYSISSTLPRLNKNISQLAYNVEKNILQMEFDSLNNNYYSNKTKSRIKILNSAKNINTNQQTSEDDDETNKILTSPQSRSISPHITVQHMSPSFMFVLQILILICLINRILMYLNNNQKSILTYH